MKIRSITVFLHPELPLQDNIQMKQAGSFIEAARHCFKGAGYEVQTTRLATTPFCTYVPDLQAETVTGLAKELSAGSKMAGFDYVSMGPALPEYPQSYAIIPDVLAAVENVFFSAVMAAPEVGISLPAVKACGEIIYRLARLDPHGFTNLYFCALANVPPQGPFFPAAYQQGSSPAFALAMETADLIVNAFTHASSLAEARQNLVSRVAEHAARLEDLANDLSAQFGLEFSGLDFSTAPFPEKQTSMGTALEALGTPAVGLHGSLAAAAFLADALDRVPFRRAGFNGLMMPFLEDATLAQRGLEGVLELKDLLLYSAVCGTGLDTVPLPGNISALELAAILLDVAALSERLKKPLTARLMPIPGKQAGDKTDFDFAYFANSRVLAAHALPLVSLLAGDEQYKMGRLER